MFEITEIGRKLFMTDFGSFLCKGVTIAILKLFRTLFWVIHRLKMWHKGVHNIEIFFFNSSDDILSKPAVDPFLILAVASVIYFSVIGPNLFSTLLLSFLVLL